MTATLFAQPRPILRPASVPTLALPPLDNSLLLEEEKSLRVPGRAPHFAEVRKVSVRPETDGVWVTNPDGTTTWRLRISSPNAESLNLGFTEFLMPQGGKLYLHTGREDNWQVRGPYTPADNEVHNQLWTPIVNGDEVVIEVSLPQTERSNLRLWLTDVNHDFLGFAANVEKSGSCNLDVVCGAADGHPIVDKYRDIIRSVVVYSRGGGTFCTGFLVNNATQDGTPYFMTADHCGMTSGNAPSLVAYYNFENSTCRTVGSAASGGNGDGVLGVNNTGAIFRAGNPATDMTLLELDDPIPAAANAFLAGWDNTLNVPTDTVIAIHHPSTDEKRISFTFQQTFFENGSNLRVPDWDLGTTEPGSSGSPIFDRFHRVRGQLEGGLAACGNDRYDTYGAIAYSWEGGGTSSTRLRDWLDPNNTGATSIDGRDVNDTTVPVELISFEGTANECNYELEWLVAREENFSHYEVEKSTNGRSFMLLERVEGGQRTYSFTDDAAKGQAFYRLKMVDMDDTFVYSNLVSAETKCGRNSIVSLYPNPVGGRMLQLDFEASITVATSLTVFSADGRKLMDRSFTETAGRTASLDLGEMPAGTYFLRIVSGGKTEVRSFVVM